MNILLIGYGKMGKIIEKLSIDRGHNIVYIAEQETPVQTLTCVNKLLNGNPQQKVDVAIEFTHPSSAVENIKWCIDNEIPVVSGTTGWFEKLKEIIDYCNQKNGSLLYGANFSVGMNIVFFVNRKLAKLFNHFDFKVSITEKHHVHKVDKPSGTAIKLAEDILKENKNFENWQLVDENNKIEKNIVPVEAIRIGEIFGEHEINWESEYEKVTLKHEAKSRIGLALGAIIAAEWLQDKKGAYSFEEFLFGTIKHI